MRKLQVYILRCSDGTYYTGVSNDVIRRVFEHNTGISLSAYTYRRRPVELVWVSDELGPNEAIDLEKQIKKWRKQKKEAIINNDWDKLPALSKSKSCPLSKKKR